jgi:predicted membrane-bound spermidine synthase
VPAFFAFFLASGFCSLLYQVVWLRLAMASFGVTAPMVAIVVSVFMAGLALGSWGAGALARRAAHRSAAFSLRLYALAELVIGLSGDFVPASLPAGRALLGRFASDAEWGSLGHYLSSGAWVALVLLPFCVCMGATFPLAMSALERMRRPGWERSFSHLYVANVLGACLGTVLSGFVLVELLGFRATLLVAAATNAAIAAAALLLSLRVKVAAREAAVPEPATPPGVSEPRLLGLLFATGLVSMGMEVVWVRQFTPYLGTVVYAFALILVTYLAATFAGSVVYRRVSSRGGGGGATGWAFALLAPAGLLALAGADPRLALADGLGAGSLRLVLGLAPFCALLGFVTPMLVDRLSGGDAARAGFGYAVNVVGCIVGPLLASFLLLPRLGDRWTLVLLAAPLAVLTVPADPASAPPRARPRWLPAASLLAAALLVAFTRDYEELFAPRLVRRDYTATVVATGSGLGKQLLVNGVGMTKLTPITKAMAHLPMALLDSPPRGSLVVCLGMGTSLRSLHSWGVPATAVELVPSVPPLVGFFHPDGERLLASPLARIVVDDGRRFLERTQGRYDVITIDPPPPIEAAGSSLLYSREFYAAARARLRPGGILQQWVPGAEPLVLASLARALSDSFPEVRVFRSLEGWGLHLLARDRPIVVPSPQEMERRMPAGAAADFVEWGPATTPAGQFARLARGEVPLGAVLALAPDVPALRDDRPLNEYYFLRRLGSGSPVVVY